MGQCGCQGRSFLAQVGRLRWWAARVVFALLAACLVLSARVASAADEEKNFAGILGIGVPRSTGYSSASGSAIEALPIELARGRKRIQPNLAFLYTSGGGSAELGAGWALEFGRIQRSPMRGIPSGSNIDEFVFSLAGSGEILVPLGGGAYRPRFESAFRQYQLVGDHWQVRDGQGTLYTFGSSPATRLDGVLWMLERIQDSNGNTVQIQYLKHGNYFYPSEIQYTGHAPTGDAGANRVVFDYEDRTDQGISFALGTEQRRSKRLTRVSNFAGGALVRRYELRYAPSPSTHRSLVQAIDLIGTDDSSRVNARSYAYQVGKFDFAATTLANPFPVAFRDDAGRDTGARFSDVNSDGFMDILDNGTRVWLGNGSGGFVEDAGWSASLVAANVRFVNSGGLDAGTRLVDVNGDQRPDLLVALNVASSTDPNATRRILLNNGLGWSASPLAQNYQESLRAIQEQLTTTREFLDPRCRDAGGADAADAGPLNCNEVVPHTVRFSVAESDGNSTGANLADVNADGLVDVVWSFQTTTTLVDFSLDGGLFPGVVFTRVPTLVQVVYLNNGSGWTRSTSYTDSLRTFPPFVVDTQLKGFDVIDVNGDGAADIVNTTAPGSTDPRTVWLSTGTGWVLNNDYTNSLRNTSIVSLSGSKPQGLVPFDFNHDGLLDYLRADESIQVAYRNTGIGFAEDTPATQTLQAFNIRFADGDGVLSGFELMDVNGDTLGDLTFSRGGSSSLRAALGPIPDLLSHARSGLGEETSLQYLPSTAFDHRTPDGIARMTATINVVSRISRGDGRGNVFTSDIAYAGGVFEQSRLGEASRFRSFANSTTLDSRNVTTVRRFAQSEALAGAVLSNEIFDAAGALRTRKSAAYTTVAAGATTQIQLAQTDDEVFDAGGTLHTRVRQIYDEHLNVVELLKDGDVGITGDEARTVFTYAKNLTVGIVSALASTSVFDATGALHSRSTSFFDGSTLAGQVTKGNATKLVDLIELPSRERSKLLEYDAYGNVVLVVDSRGGRNGFAYDPTNTYQIRVTDPLGRASTSVVDARFGTSVSDTDLNGQTSTRSYDVFGRLTRETLPGDECSPLGTRTLSYSPVGDPFTQFVRVSNTETPGQADTHDSDMFFDGFGQVYRLEIEGAHGRKNVMLTEFDDAGERRTITQPTFAGDPATQTTFQRDALRRVVAETDARGASKTTVYRGTFRDEFDPRGNKTTFTLNAYGQVTEVRQFVGGRELVTRTVYDVVGQRTRITDPAGEVTQLRYDALGNKLRLVDPALGTFDYSYDANNNLVSQRGPKGISYFEYNIANELVKKKLPDGQEIRFFYGTRENNGVGRVTRVDDSAGSLDLRYDPRGNVMERRRHFGFKEYVTGFSRDSMGRIREITYPDGFGVSYSYNPGALVSAIHDRDGNPIVSGITYNAIGEITHLEFANGVKSDYTFDSAGLMKSIDTVNSRGTALQRLSHTYDTARNVTAITDRRVASRNQAFEYDQLNRLSRATGGYGTEVYQYDEVGNFIRKANLVFARDSSHLQQVKCAIDLNLASQLKNGTKRDPKLFECLNTLLDPASGLSAADRTAVQRIKDRATLLSDNVGDSLALEYNDAGDLTRRGDKKMFYDAESRLLKVSEGLNIKELNLYGADGQRVFRDTYGSDSVFIDDLYEDEDSLLSPVVRRHVRLESSVIATVSTPSLGVHLISQAPEDRLTECKLASFGPVTSLNDARNVTGSAPQRGRFLLVLSALLLVALFVRRGGLTPLVRAGALVMRGVAHQLKRRRTLATTSLVLLAVHAVQLVHPKVAQAAVEQVSSFDNPFEKRFYYHLDHLGNTNVVSDKDGDEFERREYRPFGEQFVRSGSDALEISFNGHEFDEASEFYYFGARHYDAKLGRFLTGDTQVNDPMPQGLHRYIFNNNNPLRFIDRTGHDFGDFLEGLGVGILVGLGIAAGILLIAATGGAATPLVGLALGAAGGALIGASIAAAVGFVLLKTGQISSGEFFEIVAGGAILGASIGGAIGVIAAGGFAAGAGWATTIMSHTVFGAATGAAGAATVSLVHGPSSEDFLKAVLGGTLEGAITGAVFGVASAFGPGLLAKAGFSQRAISFLGLGQTGAGSLIAMGTLNFATSYVNTSDVMGYDDPVAKAIRKPLFLIKTYGPGVQLAVKLPGELNASPQTS